MEKQRTSITVEADINAPIEKVWDKWNDPNAITQWCTATPEWHTPRATQDLRVGGTFTTRMEAKDGSMGFDFSGVYDTVEEHKQIAYTMADGRKVSIKFNSNGDTTQVSETFDAEDQNPVEMQRGGWQAIMDSFKAYVEKN